MIATLTDWLWSYVLIIALLVVGLRLTLGTRAVQLRLFGAMFKGLLQSHLGGTQRGISGFQALVISIAGRVGGWQYCRRRRSDHAGWPRSVVLDVVDCALGHGDQRL